MKRWPPLFLASLCSAGLAISACTYAGVIGYRVNLTNSLPPGIWRVTPLADRLQRGDIVSVCPPPTLPVVEAKSRGYLSSGLCDGWFEPLFKPVVAISGDKVVIDRDGVHVNGKVVPNSQAFQEDGEGRDMHPVNFGTYRVDDRQVWLISSYNRWSFDSRYFGPVDVAAVQGRARPVLVSNVPQEWR